MDVFRILRERLDSDLFRVKMVHIVFRRSALESGQAS